MQVRSPGLPATSLAPTPLAAALSQSGVHLPIPFLDLSPQVIRDLRLENVAALQRFIAEAKSELATLAAMVQTGLEMRYGELKTDEGEAYRAFVCHTFNPWGLPAKDRSGRLDLVEPPHLGQLIAKCAQAQSSARPAASPLTTGLPISASADFAHESTPSQFSQE